MICSYAKYRLLSLLFSSGTVASYSLISSSLNWILTPCYIPSLELYCRNQNTRANVTVKKYAEIFKPAFWAEQSDRVWCCASFFPRHVKGIVLVALADGTLAIFHRGVGKDSVTPGNQGIFNSSQERNVPFTSSVLIMYSPMAFFWVVMRNVSCYFSCRFKYHFCTVLLHSWNIFVLWDGEWDRSELNREKPCESPLWSSSLLLFHHTQ